KLALYVEREIDHIGNKSVPVALPVPAGAGPQAPNAKAGGPAHRPAAGPIVSLTETRIAPEELIGGGATPAAVTGALTTGGARPPVPGALRTGGPRPARSGGADDFSWPRGIVNVEPVASDNAALDAGATAAAPTQRKSVMDAYASQTGREHKPAHRRARPRVAHDPWAYGRPNGSSFGSSGW